MILRETTELQIVKVSVANLRESHAIFFQMERTMVIHESTVARLSCYPIEVFFAYYLSISIIYEIKGYLVDAILDQKYDNILVIHPCEASRQVCYIDKDAFHSFQKL